MIAALTTHGTALIGLFGLAYLWFLFSRLLRGKIELYDFFMLSAVALVPAFFALFPQAARDLAAWAGVAFPFLLLDGFLFAVAYYFLIRLAMFVHALRMSNRTLIQEVALLRAECAAREPASTPEKSPKA